MIDKYLRYLADAIIDYFKNMFSRCRIIRNNDKIDTRYFI
jgi:hypothetical protein